MQNIISANFNVESEGYQAITTLRQAPLTDSYAILEMALVRRTDGHLTTCDFFSSGAFTSDDTEKGGLIGSLVGVLGGPVGVLLGGTTGLLAGSAIDARDADNAASLIETVGNKMQDGEISLIILAEESSEAGLDAILGRFSGEILRFDAAVIADEVERARELEKEMARQAKRELRAGKKEERKQRIEEKRAKMAEEFARFKEKFKKDK